MDGNQHAFVFWIVSQVAKVLLICLCTLRRQKVGRQQNASALMHKYYLMISYSLWLEKTKKLRRSKHGFDEGTCSVFRPCTSQVKPSTVTPSPLMQHKWVSSSSCHQQTLIALGRDTACLLTVCAQGLNSSNIRWQFTALRSSLTASRDRLSLKRSPWPCHQQWVRKVERLLCLFPPLLYICLVLSNPWDDKVPNSLCIYDLDWLEAIVLEIYREGIHLLTR